MAEEITDQEYQDALESLDERANANARRSKLALLVLLVSILLTVLAVVCHVPMLHAHPLYAVAGFMIGRAHRERQRIKAKYDAVMARLENRIKNLKASQIVREAIHAKCEWKGDE